MMAPGMSPSTRRLAYVVLRLTLGISIFVHGAGRILRGVQNFVSVTGKEFVTTPLPPTLVHLFLTIVPYAEAVIGVLILLGSRRAGHSQWAAC